MSKKQDSYRTVNLPVEGVLYKDKKSKFFGYVFPLQDENQVKFIRSAIKKRHPSAGHLCYAWQTGISPYKYRANDDGEPKNSAGLPIYGQIQAFEITHVLVVVARIYGGTKLGVGGLMSAYRNTAKLTLEQAEIIEKTVSAHFEITCSYAHMNKVMRLIKKFELELLSQELGNACTYMVAVKKIKEFEFKNAMKHLHMLEVKKINEPA